MSAIVRWDGWVYPLRQIQTLDRIGRDRQMDFVPGKAIVINVFPFKGSEVGLTVGLSARDSTAAASGRRSSSEITCI